MPPSAPAETLSPFASILTWSKAWPDWQRDALRRIVESGPLNADALQELATICRAKHGLLPATGSAPTAVPLTATHTPSGADGIASVSLTKLSGLENVGRLLSDQEIDFGNAPGLTVIYGENGAGKSGYARVIKKACLARGTPQDIKADAFTASATGPAKAKIGCRVGAVDTSVDWTDGSTIDPRLSNIFVFDSFSARVHAGEDGPACFKPRGLDVLPELAKACDSIKAELQKDIDATDAENARSKQDWKYSASTAVGKLIDALSATTKPETIDAAAVFTDADEKRLAEINATLSTDPKLKAADTAAAARRIRSFAETAMNRAVSVDDTAMQNLGDAIREAETTANAATAVSRPELKPGELPWGSNDVWRELWKAAQKFSETAAYPGKPFPVTEEGAKCVLCQQTLQADAIDRYARFNKFIADEARKQADAAKERVAALKPGVDSLCAIGTVAQGIKADLDREAAGTFAAVEAFAKAVDARISRAQKCLNDGEWADAPSLPASPCPELVTLADALDKRAKDELAAADPEKAKALAAERDELTDKKWLRDHKDEVKAQIARHARVAKLEDCQKDCTTYTITLKSGELHDAHVTAAFRKAFEDELAALGMNTLSVKLDVTKGAKGERKFGVRLVDMSKSPPVTVNGRVVEIASEGEQRCIALAAFMAELSQASHKSALVFDDPVSSLDDKRRKEIAKRLVREAEVRQVIVFTHDLAFVCDLDSATRSESRQIHYQHIEWRAGKPGSVASELIWDAKSPDQQLKELQERIGRASKVKREGSDSEYRAVVGPIVDDIRSACERIIEDVLLGDLLKRHSSQIKVGNVDRVAKVRDKDWLAVKSVWSECCGSTPAHANSKSGPHRAPEPGKLTEWVGVLRCTVEAVRNARKQGSRTTT